MIPYEVELDIANMMLQRAAEHPDAVAFHRARLTEMAEEVDAMYGAVLTNKGLAD